MAVEPSSDERLIGRIPVRNLWLLMLYASDLTRFRSEFNGLVDSDSADLPDLAAELLARVVEQRLKRNLTRGYRHREMTLTRVRGRIDVLETESRLLLQRGQVFCRFEELTIDTPRNQLVRSALELLGRVVRRGPLSCRCRALASGLARAGVSGRRPSRADLAPDQIGRNDTPDRLMIALALLALDLALPTEESGPTALVAPDREEVWVRRLFEKAVLGFARFELEPLGWCVRGGGPIHWQQSSASVAISGILLRMVTDIVLDPPDGGRRLIVDTKFTSILRRGRFGGAAFKSEYIYQIYSYVRSQEGVDAGWDRCGGLLLHPCIDLALDEQVVIQRHMIRFATVNLSGSAPMIREELRRILSR